MWTSHWKPNVSRVLCIGNPVESSAPETQAISLSKSERTKTKRPFGKWPYLIMFIRTNIANQCWKVRYRRLKWSPNDVTKISNFGIVCSNLISLVWTFCICMGAFGQMHFDEWYSLNTFGERFRDDLCPRISPRALWLMSALKSSLKIINEKSNLKGKFLTDN